MLLKGWQQEMRHFLRRYQGTVVRDPEEAGILLIGGELMKIAGFPGQIQGQALPVRPPLFAGMVHKHLPRFQ
ncbi:hypothetical protein D3C76_1344860 [compost metagenome]